MNVYVMSIHIKVAIFCVTCYFVFWDRVSHSQICPFLLPSDRGTGICRHTQIFTWVLGIQTRVVMPAEQVQLQSHLCLPLMNLSIWVEFNMYDVFTHVGNHHGK